MATITAPVAVPNLELVETDGVPLDSTWHRDAINLLIEIVRTRFRERHDYFVGGNMFIYFSQQQVRNRDFRGPDFFYVKGVKYDPLRPYWVVWDEDGKYPDVILELLSPSTAAEDRTTKKDVYERTFRTPDYFCYDPDTQKLEGWHLVGQSYQPLQPNERGWLWSAQLELWLGIWTGEYQGCHATWLRFYDAQGNLLPLSAESEAQRADAAEAELARLKTLLAEKGISPDAARDSRE
jgi:Uma2 family endonuclease